jgi:ATP-dependent DNA helicase RecQ
LDKRPVISAFTATATPRVREDILRLLELRNPEVLVSGFDRPNLYFEVQKPKDKLRTLLSFLRERKDKSGIVYCSTRASVEEVCTYLNLNGFRASRYHAGLTNDERRQNQDDFLYDRVQIMTATNAFGMGIDKSNIAFVVHFNMPMDIESYYQEAGRAGRDGSPADCLLLYSGKDWHTNQWLIEHSRIEKPAETYPDYESLWGEPAGHAVTPGEREAEAHIKALAKERLRNINLYCATGDCLRTYILKYFGEAPAEDCGNCGNCAAETEAEDITEEAQKILSCVIRMKERYGAGMVADVLRGIRSEKVSRQGLDKLSTFGISEMPDKRLREIIDYLAMNGYLSRAGGEYPILRRGGRAEAVLRGQERVFIKFAGEAGRKTGHGPKPAAARPIDQALFERLKALRLSIANAQSVPAFVIFADSTLADMCLKLPQTADAFLNVSGVGQVKLERYGEVFLREINEYINNAPSAHDNSPMSYDPASVELCDDPMSVSRVADQINCLFIQCGYKKITGQKINDWLVSQGYMQTAEINEKVCKQPTEQGMALGITGAQLFKYGETIWKNWFSREAQAFIAQHALQIREYKTKITY